MRAWARGGRRAEVDRSPVPGKERLMFAHGWNWKRAMAAAAAAGVLGVAAPAAVAQPGDGGPGGPPWSEVTPEQVVERGVARLGEVTERTVGLLEGATERAVSAIVSAAEAGQPDGAIRAIGARASERLIGTAAAGNARADRVFGFHVSVLERLGAPREAFAELGAAHQRSHAAIARSLDGSLGAVRRAVAANTGGDEEEEGGDEPSTGAGAVMFVAVGF